MRRSAVAAIRAVFFGNAAARARPRRLCSSLLEPTKGFVCSADYACGEPSLGGRLASVLRRGSSSPWLNLALRQVTRENERASYK